MKTIKAKCLSLEYKPGDYYTSQGHKKGSRIKQSGDYTCFPQDTGWGKNIKPSRLILQIGVEGKRYETWVDSYFKNNVGRLTEKRIDRIEANLPEVVEVMECEGSKVGKYYVVSEESMDAWLRATGL